MPGGDRTGPLGEGPMTGGGFGYCGGYNIPGAGYMRPFFGRGLGLGWGSGRGRRRGLGLGQRWGAPVYIYDAPYSGEYEAEMLRQQAKYLEGTLEQIKQRLTHLNEHSENKRRDKSTK